MNRPTEIKYPLDENGEPYFAATHVKAIQGFEDFDNTEDIGDLRQIISNINTSVTSLQTDMQTLNTKYEEIIQEIETLKQEVKELKNDSTI